MGAKQQKSRQKARQSKKHQRRNGAQRSTLHHKKFKRREEKQARDARQQRVAQNNNCRPRNRKGRRERKSESGSSFAASVAAAPEPTTLSPELVREGRAIVADAPKGLKTISECVVTGGRLAYWSSQVTKKTGTDWLRSPIPLVVALVSIVVLAGSGNLEHVNHDLLLITIAMLGILASAATELAQRRAAA